jgi:hypothetical protein
MQGRCLMPPRRSLRRAPRDDPEPADPLDAVHPTE